MKSIIKKYLNKFGYQIKKIDNGFTFNNNLDWLLKLNIKTIIDVGSNEGQFAKFIYGYLPSVTIYSFEPLPLCFEKLKKLKKEIHSLHPLNIALGEINGFEKFYQNDFSPSSSFMQMKESHVLNFPQTKKSKQIDIEIQRLDDLVPSLNIVPEVMVKIDVQGYEEKVINGGIEFFKKIPKIILIEASIRELYENEISFDEIYKLFVSLGYKYQGNLYQLYSPLDGEILQVDAVFIKC